MAAWHGQTPEPQDDGRIHGYPQVANEVRVLREVLKTERAEKDVFKSTYEAAMRDLHQSNMRLASAERGIDSLKEQKQQLEMEIARIRNGGVAEIVDNHDVISANENEYLLVSHKWIGKIRADNDSKDIEVRQWRIVAAIAFAAGFAIASIVLSSL